MCVHGFLPQLCPTPAYWSAIFSSLSRRISGGVPHMSSLDANQICRSAGTPRCFTGLCFADTLQYLRTYTFEPHPVFLRITTFLSSHPRSFLPPPSAACPSPIAGTPLSARGQSQRGQNYYYFCVTTRGKERQSEMKVNDAVGGRCAGVFSTSFGFSLYSFLSGLSDQSPVPFVTPCLGQEEAR